ncbi:MAG TPA: metalloregulator ArsR/SmtB family transcription factor [Pyrinomonadaceae bacterium]|nr:metalloregulator ArsR/SmtB family transcription factor [Pyrinomonadaceae bacterium]
MNPETILAGTASLFLALGDKTRLRLLNLMRDREICVSSFTGVLEQSQPLVSRHLAYLRNSGVVEARREGKWMHYSIASNLDENTGRLLFELFKWMEQQEGLRSDRDKYFSISGEAPPAPIVIEPPVKPRRQTTRSRQPRKVPVEKAPEIEQPVYEYEAETYGGGSDDYRDVHHNELEDFLL